LPRFDSAEQFIVYLPDLRRQTCHAGKLLV